MTFEPARPRYTLPFAGKDYELLGTFELIEAVEYAAKDHIGKVAVRLVNGMQGGEFASVLVAILHKSGHRLSAEEVKGLLWERVGLTGEAYDLLCLHLYSFLSICLAPPGNREKATQTAGELFGKLKAASPGNSTEESA